MNYKKPGFSAACVAALLVLSGCATTGSVKHAQSTADQALEQAQAANGAAQHAQASADSANAAAQRAQGTADGANTAAQNANAAAQAAGNDARTAGGGIASLESRVHRLERTTWCLKHGCKRHHRHRHHHHRK